MEKYRVKPGSQVHLDDYDPNDRREFNGTKEEANREVARLVAETDKLQERLYAEHERAVLFVFQGMDTSGKDSTIRHVFSGLNPIGCRVTSFKAPSVLELDHDYLWRVHSAMPRRGEIGLFNRSHYEDVLVTRVHNLPREVWGKRYNQINDFETMLTQEGTTIVKFFLHISKDEQKKQLRERLDDPEKQWKFDPNDLKERALWDEYINAYQDALSKTSTDWAPWYIVPANRKWYRNLVVANVVWATLDKLNPQFPPPKADLDKIVIE